MTSWNDLELEQKINLIRESERGLSYRELKDKFQVSISAVAIFLNENMNILMIINVIEIKS